MKLTFANHPRLTLSQGQSFTGVIENFFERELYEKLRESFPKVDFFDDNSGYGKQKFHNYASRFQKFVATEPLWNEVFRWFDSMEFIEDVRPLILDELERVRGPVVRGEWIKTTYSTKDKYAKGQFPVAVTCEFSRLGRGSSVPPHTDSTAKLFSLLVYFAPDDWKKEYGGGTDFYSTRNPKWQSNWYNYQTGFSAVNTVESWEYVPNRAVFFVKNENSWHGVRPLECPADMSRNSFLVNISTPFRGLAERKMVELRRRLFPIEAALR